MKNFIINEDLANAVFTYLSTRPYREVAQLMAGLGQIVETVNPADAEEQKKPAAKKTA